MVLKIPADHYYDPARWRQEVDKVFKRMPLMLAVSAEMREPGSYKSMEAAGVPVLIVRGDDIGSSHAANVACIQCYREGIVRSVEVMVPEVTSRSSASSEPRSPRSSCR